jgi:hypothetical protein
MPLETGPTWLLSNGQDGLESTHSLIPMADDSHERSEDPNGNRALASEPVANGIPWSVKIRRAPEVTPAVGRLPMSDMETKNQLAALRGQPASRSLSQARRLDPVVQAAYRVRGSEGGLMGPQTRASPRCVRDAARSRDPAWR